MLYVIVILLILIYLNTTRPPSGGYPFRSLAHEERFRRREEKRLAKAKKYLEEHYQGMSQREIIDAEARRGWRFAALFTLLVVGLFLLWILYAMTHKLDP